MAEFSREIGRDFFEGEKKVEPGELISIDRITLPEKELERLKTILDQSLQTMLKINPETELRLEEARVIATNSGELQIIVPTYMRFTGEKLAGCLLRVARWHWDLDNKELKKFTDFFNVQNKCDMQNR